MIRHTLPCMRRWRVACWIQSLSADQSPGVLGTEKIYRMGIGILLPQFTVNLLLNFSNKDDASPVRTLCVCGLYLSRLLSHGLTESERRGDRTANSHQHHENIDFHIRGISKEPILKIHLEPSGEAGLWNVVATAFPGRSRRPP